MPQRVGADRGRQRRSGATARPLLFSSLRAGCRSLHSPPVAASSLRLLVGPHTAVPSAGMCVALPPLHRYARLVGAAMMEAP